MVGTLKRWLGIDVLERENLILARAIKAHTERLDTIERGAAEQKSLTPEPVRPKIEPKPKRMNWQQTRAMLERETEEET
jgi:hypothetical protein